MEVLSCGMKFLSFEDLDEQIWAVITWMEKWNLSKKNHKRFLFWSESKWKLRNISLRIDIAVEDNIKRTNHARVLKRRQNVCDENYNTRKRYVEVQLRTMEDKSSFWWSFNVIIIGRVIWTLEVICALSLTKVKRKIWSIVFNDGDSENKSEAKAFNIIRRCFFLSFFIELHSSN